MLARISQSSSYHPVHRTRQRTQVFRVNDQSGHEVDHVAERAHPYAFVNELLAQPDDIGAPRQLHRADGALDAHVHDSGQIRAIGELLAKLRLDAGDLGEPRLGLEEIRGDP